ncbi:restriction endonuclease subunit S [Sphingobacterium multivorum]|uniref:restriction endonuclease subunit S n=1 Tax=Sphingobacterium multivorum TaxID=28454 RepID=UPI003DA205C4
MTKQSENKNIPELRFPEFKDDGEWEEESVRDVYEFKTTNSLPRENLSYDDGIIKNIHYGDIHTKFETLFSLAKEEVPYIKSDSIVLDKLKKDSYCKEGDMIFADASEDIDDIGKSIEILDLNNEKLVSGLHTILARPKDTKLIVGFGGYLFKSEPVRKQIQRESQGAKVLGVSATRLSNVKISFPKNGGEQKKVADCLSSLDEVITANTEKLDVLKDHKKGLMQTLFSQKGEKMPKYRFKEFENDKEWKNTTFKNYVLIIDGDRGINYPKSEEYNSQGYCVFLNAKNVTKEGFVFNEIQFITKEKDDLLRKGKLEKLDIVLTTRGTLGQFSFFNESVPFQNIRINSGMVILRANDNVINQDYLYHYCRSNIIQSEIKSRAFGNAVQQLTVSIINSFPLIFPENLKEQTKIADTLSSLDDLIAAQSEKIEQLKTHKKGLMQKLFPAINE